MGQLSEFVFIDDDEIDQMGARRLMRQIELGQASHYVCPVKGLEALTKKPDVPRTVFLDINMPLMTGFEFLEALEAAKQFSPESLRVYILSTSAQQQERCEAAESPFYRGWFVKPLTKENILNIYQAKNSHLFQYHSPLLETLAV